MTAVLLRTRAELRARWKAWVSLTVMLGIFGGTMVDVALCVLGQTPSPAISLVAMIPVVPATLVLANLIAFLPGRAAGRMQAATVLRTER